MATKNRYRVLVGKHAQNEPRGPNGEQVMCVYKKGEVFESETDICGRFNPADPAATRKFEAVEDGTPVSTPNTKDQRTAINQPNAPVVPEKKDNKKSSHNPTATLESMDEVELRKVCDAEEVNHKNLKTKPELIAALKKVMTP